MEMVECSLPPLKLQDWNKECYALIVRSKKSIIIKYASTSLEDVRRYAIEKFGPKADVPIDTMFLYETDTKKWKQYIRCEYKIYLYYNHLKERGCITRCAINEIEGREVLIYAGICMKHRTRFRNDR